MVKTEQLVWRHKDGSEKAIKSFSDEDMTVVEFYVVSFIEWYKAGPTSQEIANLRTSFIQYWMPILIGDPAVTSIPNDVNAIIRMVSERDDFNPANKKKFPLGVGKEQLVWRHKDATEELIYEFNDEDMIVFGFYVKDIIKHFKEGQKTEKAKFRRQAFIKKWTEKLLKDSSVTEIPSDEDSFIREIKKRLDFKSRKQRDEEKK